MILITDGYNANDADDDDDNVHYQTFGSVSGFRQKLAIYLYLCLFHRKIILDSYISVG